MLQWRPWRLDRRGAELRNGDDVGTNQRLRLRYQAADDEEDEDEDDKQDYYAMRWFENF